MSIQENKKVRWEEMFPDELYQKIQDEPVCYLAYGLAEPHGPYNALGLDWLKAHTLVEHTAQRHGGVVAPPFAWPGLGLKVSNWLGPPCIQRRIQAWFCCLNCWAYPAN